MSVPLQWHKRESCMFALYSKIYSNVYMHTIKNDVMETLYIIGIMCTHAYCIIYFTLALSQSVSFLHLVFPFVVHLIQRTPLSVYCSFNFNEKLCTTQYTLYSDDRITKKNYCVFFYSSQKRNEKFVGRAIIILFRICYL